MSGPAPGMARAKGGKRGASCIHLSVTSPDLEPLRTEISGLAFALSALSRDTSKKLDKILELASGFTPAQVEQLERITSKVEAIDKKENQ